MKIKDQQNQTSPLVNPQVEQTLKEIILKDLANKGRKDYDKPHTQAVVHWMKELLQQLNKPRLDSSVLITAAYAHDWGYAGLFADANSRSLNNIIERKDQHMKRGAEKIEQLLYQRLANYFSEAQKLRIAHLVLVHDRVRELEDEDELLLMEADTLGMLDVERVTPNLSPADEKRFMEQSIHKLRVPRFIHHQAKQIAKKLIAKREKYQQ